MSQKKVMAFLSFQILIPKKLVSGSTFFRISGWANGFGDCEYTFSYYFSIRNRLTESDFQNSALKKSFVLKVGFLAKNFGTWPTSKGCNFFLVKPIGVGLLKRADLRIKGYRMRYRTLTKEKNEG